MFRDGMFNRRCLIPANNYFEWEKRGKERVKYAIRPSVRLMLYMAGVYRIENGKAVFSILTREPAEQISFIHDRMQVILPGIMKDAWLDLQRPASEVLHYASWEMDFRTA